TPSGVEETKASQVDSGSGARRSPPALGRSGVRLLPGGSCLGRRRGAGCGDRDSVPQDGFRLGFFGGMGWTGAGGTGTGAVGIGPLAVLCPAGGFFKSDDGASFAKVSGGELF